MSPSYRQRVLRAGGAAAALAAAANLVIYSTARAADVGLTVHGGGSTARISAAQVAFTSIVPIALATIAAAATRGTRRTRWISAAAIAVTLLSLGGPLSMGVGSATKVALAAMHVVAGASFVILLHRAADERVLTITSGQESGARHPVSDAAATV